MEIACHAATRLNVSAERDNLRIFDGVPFDEFICAPAVWVAELMNADRVRLGPRIYGVFSDSAWTAWRKDPKGSEY